MNNVGTSLMSTQTLRGTYCRHLYSSAHILQCPNLDFTMTFCKVLVASLSALSRTILVQQHDNSHSAQL